MMDRPRVVLNFAMSVDGKIASAAHEPGRLAGDADLRHLYELRATADAVVVGAGTVRAIDPPLSSKEQPLVLVVISASGNLDPSARAFTEGDASARVIATTEEARLPDVDGVEIWRVGTGRVDPAQLLRRLAERGVERIVVEGGGETNAAFVEANLVDELFVTVAPALLGGRAAPTPIDGAGLGMDRRRRLRLESVREVDGELFCHYLVEGR